jgi:tyrosyl-tRNA synthetase
MNVITDEKQLDELLSRGIAEILPDKESFKSLLLSGERIKIYQGFDPSADKLHIGNAIGMMMLERFRRLGHHVIFLIGTGTGKVGDPTDKLATRKVLDDEQIKKNIAGWKDQASQILDFDNDENPVEILKNGDWLNDMTFADFLNIGNKVTIQQLLERDMFKKRLNENKPISVSEMLYPIMQGYDSVAMEVDAEFGGSDQLFNMMMGRTLLKQIKNKEKWVITGKLLEDNQGIKMGKSLGNVINLTDSPEDIYGKVMSFTDGLIIPGFEILTEVPMDKVKEYEQQIKNSENPLTYKKMLAFEVTKWIKGENGAQIGQENFEKTVQGQEVPEELSEVNLTLSDEMIAAPTVSEIFKELSGAERKRIIKQGGFEIDGVKITDPGENISKIIKDGSILRLGKRNYRKIKLQ